MLANFNLSDPIDLFTILIGTLLLLKKLAEQDRNHLVMAGVFTAALYLIMVNLFLSL
jgi:hypothetical protein